MELCIKLDRLKQDLTELAQIGRTAGGGISRPSFSKADLEARLWLKDRFKKAGLAVRQDGAGNLFGRIEGRGKTVMAGSHIDTVLNGGMYDGAVGVLSALECLRLIQEEGVPHTKPLEAAAFTDEEGNLVGDFLGSRAFAGVLNRDMLKKGITQFGLPLTEILTNTEFSIDSILKAHTERPEVGAFLELHIEQGTVLETEDKPIGIVERAAGKRYFLCSFTGEVGHAGTIPFELRHDAFLGLSDFALKGTQYVATQHYGSLMTIGKIHAHPGSFSIIPGLVEFSLDFRSPSQETIEELDKSLIALAKEVALTRGLQFASKLMDRTDPVRFPSQITNILSEESEKLGYPHMKLTSGAGHDAQILAGVADSGMIFIPCEDGISHSPEEKIEWENLEKGANLLLHALLRLAA